MAVLHRFYCTHNAVGWSVSVAILTCFFWEQICLQNYLPDRYPRIKCISDFLICVSKYICCGYYEKKRMNLLFIPIYYLVAWIFCLGLLIGKDIIYYTASFSLKKFIANYTNCCANVLLLTLYSIRTPFDAFEISHVRKYYGKRSICSFGANAPSSIIFSKVFKT